MYINGKKVGHAVLPLNRPAGGWINGGVLQGKPSDLTWKGINYNSPIIMIGCHRNADDKKFRDFCMPNVLYDELAIWVRRLGNNASVDETLYFMGGYGNFILNYKF